MKKGQMYIFAAVILCTFAVTLLLGYSKTDLPDRENRWVRDNFFFEANKVVNTAFINGDNVSEALSDYIDDYSDYVKSNNLNLRLAYGLTQGNETRIVNLLNEDITVIYDGYEASLNDSDALTITSDSFTLSVEGKDYSFNLTDTPDIKMKFLMRLEKR